jgi:hypothetical protein
MPFSAGTRLIFQMDVGYGRSASLKQAHAERAQRRLQHTYSVKPILNTTKL